MWSQDFPLKSSSSKQSSSSSSSSSSKNASDNSADSKLANNDGKSQTSEFEEDLVDYFGEQASFQLLVLACIQLFITQSSEFLVLICVELNKIWQLSQVNKI